MSTAPRLTRLLGYSVRGVMNAAASGRWHRRSTKPLPDASFRRPCRLASGGESTGFSMGRRVGRSSSNWTKYSTSTSSVPLRSTYPDTIRLGFSKDSWIDRCLQKRKLEGDGFKMPRPPLFPNENGRHQQRAFRDALADILPQEHGFAPTLRLADSEVRDWISEPGAVGRMAQLVADRLGDA